MTKATELFTAIRNSSDWAKHQTLRNLCYGTYQDKSYQINVMSDNQAAIKEILERDDGSEINQKNMQDHDFLYSRAEDQLPEFEQLHSLACEAYKEATGETWSHRPKRNTSSAVVTATAEKWKKKLA